MSLKEQLELSSSGESSDEEIMEVLNSNGQLYFTKAGKEAPKDKPGEFDPRKVANVGPVEAVQPLEIRPDDDSDNISISDSISDQIVNGNFSVCF